MSFERGNRSVNYLSVPERVAVIQEYDATQNIAHLARKFRCGRRQIRHILARREDYLAEWMSNPNARRMPRRGPSRVRAVNIVLNTWVRRSRLYDVDISEDLMREVGKKIAASLQIEEFRSDNRWMERFKKKYKIDEVLEAEPDLEYDINAKQSLGIEDIIQDLRAEVDAAMDCRVIEYSTQGMVMRRNTGNCMISENSNEAIEYIDVLTDSCPSDESSEISKVEKKPGMGSSSAGSNYYEDSGRDSQTAAEVDMDGPAVQQIESYREALNHLGPLEQFVLFKENIRAIGLINQIENIFRHEMEKAEQKPSG